MSPKLSSLEMAKFAVDGMLVREAIVPDHLNSAVLEDVASGTIAFKWFPYKPAASELRNYGALADVLGLPDVAGMVESLVGENPVLDHVGIHRNPAGWRGGQEWHSDDPAFDARLGFDIQLYYFPHDTPVEMGGTLFLPASHTRHVDEFGIGRYLNIVGQRQIVCPAGTVVASHHAIWHCGARPNLTDSDRTVVKVRLNRTTTQSGRWGHVDMRADGVALELMRFIPWNDHEYGMDHLARVKLWRHLTGDHAFDSAQGIAQRIDGPE